MKRRLLFLLACAVFSAASSAHAEDQRGTTCNTPQAVLDRGWMAYAAKNSVSPGAQANVGARLLAFSTLMMHCTAPGQASKPAIKLDPLNAEERESFRSFVPHGPMAALAACLVRSASADALQFVLKSDVAAYAQYQATHNMGAVDDAALSKLLASAKGCGSLMQPKVNANELYADLNWHKRIQPNLERIIAWHAKGGVS